jgi:hypothetical protein
MFVFVTFETKIWYFLENLVFLNIFAKMMMKMFVFANLFAKI